MSKPADKYKYCNHHHEMKEDQELVDFGTGEFVADKKMIPLLKALNDLGLITRTHNYHEGGCFFSILFRNDLRLEIRPVGEISSDRDFGDGEMEVLFLWNKTKNK